MQFQNPPRNCAHLKRCKAGSKALLERAFKIGSDLLQEGSSDARRAGRSILKRCNELAAGRRGLISALVASIAGWLPYESLMWPAS